ncbi:hypothetical protein SDRG_13237 [Saprolegnia diclina VS20]|uniref:PX domain-containing protein n=1 Tax=Saprolegnia diclina (strain VS20) TaxID=1156394 RepID=T0RA97_SAPDV|nr:hypothetical protein SDRG_13237 [Saprolegnia diclina VS20]EQC29078.1 hypothetical protein SDRG_13237 [Saprolegnia diclina VS20]|eukprot:XP_008617537.1 hypothetical protein SDRG_13237 [Saprolegnia diclina VS20]
MIRHVVGRGIVTEKSSSAKAAPTPMKPTSMKGYLIHCVVPQQAGDYTEYAVVVEDSRGRSLWEVKRRYSVVADLRDNLDDVFDAPHCHYCKGLAAKLRALPFPAKKLFHTDDVLSQRAIDLHAYMEALLKIGANPLYRNCTLVATQAHWLLQRFFTSGQVRYLSITPRDQREGRIPCLLRQLQLTEPPLPKKHGYSKCSLAPILELAPPMAC